MKKSLVILLLSLNIIFGMSNKWNLITNNSYPLVKFKFAKSFIEERIGPRNLPRGTFVGETNRKKYLDSDGYYRFGVEGIVFNDKEGYILQDISIADADKLANPFYRSFNKRNAVYKELTSLDQFKEFSSSDAFENLSKTASKYGIDKYIKESKKMRIIKISFVLKYKQGIYIPYKMKRIDSNGDMIIMTGAYLIKKDGKWESNIIRLGRGNMFSNIFNFIDMVQGDMSKITTTVDDGYDYPLVKF